MANPHRSVREDASEETGVHRRYVKLQDLELNNKVSTASQFQRLETIEEHGHGESSIGAITSSPPKIGTVIDINADTMTPSTSPSLTMTNSSNEFQSFAHTLPFTLTINTINYPVWSKNEMRPLPYLPVPLAPLPGIPAIPTKLDISFTQIMDTMYFKDTIDEILQSQGYTFRHERISKVWVSFTHKNGKRERLGVSAEHVSLITWPWAKDVWLGHLDCVAGNCACEECSAGQHGNGQYGHGLVVEIAFPQGFEKQRKNKDAAVERGDVSEYWAGRKKLPFHQRSQGVPRAVNYVTSVTKVRF